MLDPRTQGPFCLCEADVDDSEDVLQVVEQVLLVPTPLSFPEVEMQVLEPDVPLGVEATAGQERRELPGVGFARVHGIGGRDVTPRLGLGLGRDTLEGERMPHLQVLEGWA